MITLRRVQKGKRAGRAAGRGGAEIAKAKKDVEGLWRRGARLTCLWLRCKAGERRCHAGAWSAGVDGC